PAASRPWRVGVLPTNISANCWIELVGAAGSGAIQLIRLVVAGTLPVLGGFTVSESLACRCRSSLCSTRPAKPLYFLTESLAVLIALKSEPSFHCGQRFESPRSLTMG